jgi:hypothetical protein
VLRRHHGGQCPVSVGCIGNSWQVNQVCGGAMPTPLHVSSSLRIVVCSLDHLSVCLSARTANSYLVFYDRGLQDLAVSHQAPEGQQRPSPPLSYLCTTHSVRTRRPSKCTLHFGRTRVSSALAVVALGRHQPHDVCSTTRYVQYKTLKKSTLTETASREPSCHEHRAGCMRVYACINNISWV